MFYGIKAMVKLILIKSSDEWASTKQVGRVELVVYLFLHSMYNQLTLSLIGYTSTCEKSHRPF